MINRKQVEVADRKVEVKELTVEQLDMLLGVDPATYQVSTLDRILEQHIINGAILSASCGLTEEELIKLAPSRLRLLVDTCKEVNPDFFEMARRDLDRAKALEKLLESDSGSAPLA